MIIVTATMYPQGQQSGTYEVLHTTISNTSPPGRSGLTGDSYIARVVARPNPRLGMAGFEADVEVMESFRRDGLAPLLSGILGAANPIPLDREASFKVLRRLELTDVAAFDRLLRGKS